MDGLPALHPHLQQIVDEQQPMSMDILPAPQLSVLLELLLPPSPAAAVVPTVLPSKPPPPQQSVQPSAQPSVAAAPALISISM
jgi:hypothetical protein